MDEEPFGIDGKSYRIVYQGKRNKSEHHRQSKQHQADIPYIIIHGINQLFPVKHILYIGILLHQFLYFRNAVGIGIVGMELDFEGRSKWIITQELLGIGSLRFRLLLQSLFFRDIFRKKR